MATGTSSGAQAIAPIATTLAAPVDPMSLRSILPWALACIVVAAWYVPWCPPVPAALLDSGWALGLSIAWENGLSFGRQVLFTFGPLGAFVTWQYWPSTYAPALCLWFVIGALPAVLWITTFTRVSERIVGLMAIVWMGLLPDSGLMALPVVYVLAGRRLSLERTSGIAMRAVPDLVLALSAAALAVIALTKFTLVPVCLAALACVAAMRGGSDRGRGWRDVAIFALSTIVAWVVIARQPLSDFWLWITGAFEIARAYPQAMALSGDTEADRWMSYLLAAVALGVVCTTAWADVAAGRRAEGRRRRVAGTAFFVLVVAIATKHGITRGDGIHLMTGFTIIGAAGLAALASAERTRPVGGDAFGRAIAAISGRWSVLLACIVSAFVATWLLNGQGSVSAQGRAVHQRLSLIRSAIATLTHGMSLRERLDRELAVWRASLPRPDPATFGREGTFDIIGHDQYLLAALPSQRWAPRPVLQSYSAYSRRLAAADAEHLKGDAPEWLFVRVAAIDGRLPGQDDAALWPEMRRRYDVAGRYAGNLVLHRRDRPREDPAASTFESQVDGKDWIPIPAAAGEEFHLRVMIDRSLGDRLRAFLWRPSDYRLQVAYGDGAPATTFRLVPEISSVGVLLFPSLESIDAVRKWIDRDTAIGRRPTSVRVVDKYGVAVQTAYSLSSLPFSYSVTP